MVQNRLGKAAVLEFGGCVVKVGVHSGLLPCFNSNELEPQVYNSNLLLAQAVESKLRRTELIWSWDKHKSISDRKSPQVVVRGGKEEGNQAWPVPAARDWRPPPRSAARQPRRVRWARRRRRPGPAGSPSTWSRDTQSAVAVCFWWTGWSCSSPASARACSRARRLCGSYRGLLMTLKLGGMLQLASSWESLLLPRSPFRYFLFYYINNVILLLLGAPSWAMDWASQQCWENPFGSMH